MFELKYKITDDDMRAVNKRIMLFYFVLYFAVAVVGVVVGVVAVVLDTQRSIFVMGIIILVMAGLLLALSLIMLVAPKNYAASRVAPSDAELSVTVDKHGVTVDGNNIAPFVDITSIKRRKNGLWVYTGKSVMLLIKPCVVSGQSFEELYSYMAERRGRILIEPASEQGGTKSTEDADDGKQNDADDSRQNL